MEFLLLVPLALLVGLGMFLAPSVIYRRARRKGYRAPGAALVVLVTLAATIGLTLPFLPSGVGLGPNQFLFWEFGPPTTVFWIVGLILVAVLPRGSGRVSGERHVNFPFVLVGWTVGAGGFVVVAIALWFCFSGRQAFPLVLRTFWLAGVLIAFGRYLVGRGRTMANQPVLERVLADDSRSPVLYLRAFNQEGQAFAVGDASKYGAYVEGWQGVAVAGQRVEVPFEQYFHRSIETRLGPFVALGSPEDYVPPHGAVRHYATDETWQPELARLAKQARCILAEVNTAGNLRWEFEHLRSKGYQKKLFFFSIPEDAAAPWRSAWGRSFGGIRGLIPPVAWNTFADELGSLGYELSSDDPGPGSLITFDAHGRQVLLTTEADLPEDFIEPLEAWLTNKKKTGRCTPVSCSTCGCTFHVHAQNAQPPPFLCRGCRSPHRSARRVAAGILAAAMGIFGALAYGGSLDSFFAQNVVFGNHPRIVTTVVLGILGVVLLFVVPYETAQP
jgi:hypothetical protein